tara:strand:- start:631 stop:738 length:108 start_codon:yes stop_codon:yes gene_type:complete
LLVEAVVVDLHLEVVEVQEVIVHQGMDLLLYKVVH